ncbi:MAG: hypothetical protein ABR549_10320 [Mycobacteriales bacterium]
MTSPLVRRSTLPAVRQGGPLRRFLVASTSAVVWTASVLLLSAGFVPELDGDESEVSIRITFLVLGVAVGALPVVLVWLPHRRLVLDLVEGVLAVETPRPVLPPVAGWVGPDRMFQRLRWTSYTLVLVPLITLLVVAAYGMYLDEDAAGLVALVFCSVPLTFLVVTVKLPNRCVEGVQAGVDAGQVVPVCVPRRLDRGMLFSSACQSWFETRLPDGQLVLLRTPTHFAWAADARGVIDSPELVLVVGRGGHQGALLVPTRPEHAVWLLGPVPQVRAPREVLRAFAEPGEE